MRMEIISIKNLSKSFGKVKAIDNLSLKIFEGEIFSLLGPNGAGKTTLVNILSGILKADTGEVKILGKSIKKIDEIKKSIGVSPQETVLSEKLTAWENVYFWGGIYGMKKKEIKKRGEVLFEKFSLKERANDLVATFSGGMKRRLNIILSLLHDPQVLFLDEPTLGLDPQSRRVIWDLIEELKKEKKTVLLTTHYMEEANYLADRVGIIDKGKIIALDSPEKLKEKFLKEGILSLKVKEKQKEIAFKLLKEKFSAVKMFKDVIKIYKKIPLKEVIDFLYEKNIEVIFISQKEVSLEDVFLKLTGRSLRD